MKTHGTLLLLTIAWGALTFGAVYPWAYWPLALACAWLGVAGLRQDRKHLRVPAAALALSAFALGVLIQLAPLPRRLLLTLGPSTDAFLRQYYLAYALDPPAWHPLSIVPASTWLGLGLFSALALFLVGTSRILRHLDLETLVRRVMLFAVALGAFGVVQRALQGDPDIFRVRLIYGFWRPEEGGNPFGPFVNRNHFAGWMLLALPLTLGYGVGLIERFRPRGGSLVDWFRWVVSTETGPVVLAGFSALIAGTALVLTGSRSGVISFAVAVFVMAAFVLRAFDRRSTRLMTIVLAALLVTGAIGWAGSGATIQRFATSDRDLEGRFAAWRDTARISQDFPVFGTGLNTFGYAMLVYQSGDRRVFYREAHNDYLQLVAEGGVLLTLPALLAVGFFVRDVRRRFHDGEDSPMTHWIRVGAVAALAGIEVQSLMDFSLQMPGNAALFALVAAIAMHKPSRRHRAPRM